MMNFKNLFKNKPKIKVGDTVKCIDDRDWNSNDTDIKLVYGKTYKIIDITYTTCCGSVCLDIGGRFIVSRRFTVCNKNKSNHGEIQGMGIHWAAVERFALHIGESEEETTNKEELKQDLEIALLLEDHKKANELRTLINY